MKKILILALIIALMIVPAVLASEPFGIHIDPLGDPPAVDGRIPAGCQPEGNSPIIVIENPTQGQMLVRCGC